MISVKEVPFLHLSPCKFVQVFHFNIMHFHLRRQGEILAILPTPSIKEVLLWARSCPTSNQMALRILALLLHYEDLRNMDVLGIT